MNFKHKMWVICLYKSKNNFKVHVVWLVLHKFGLKHLDSRDFSRSFRVDLKLPLIFLFTLFFIINTFSSVTIYFIYKMFLLVISKNWIIQIILFYGPQILKGGHDERYRTQCTVPDFLCTVRYSIKFMCTVFFRFWEKNLKTIIFARWEKMFFFFFLYLLKARKIIKKIFFLFKRRILSNHKV